MDALGNDAGTLFHFPEPYAAQTTQAYPAAGSWADLLHEMGTYDNGAVSSDLSGWFQDGLQATASHGGDLDHVHDLLILGDDQLFGFDQLGFLPDDHRPEEAAAPALGDPLDEWLDLVAEPHGGGDAHELQEQMAAVMSFPEDNLCMTPLPSTGTPQPDVLLAGYQYTCDLPSTAPSGVKKDDEPAQKQKQKQSKKRPASKVSKGSTKGGTGREKQRRHQQEAVMSYDDCDEEELEEDCDDVIPRPPSAVLVGSQQLNCKNLVSERNRRKRLSQQLLALRALVPNITKMDKRSVLVDALSYLKGIHEETAKIQAELAREQRQRQQQQQEQGVQANDAGVGQRQPNNNDNNGMSPPGSRTAATAHVLEVDVERMEDRRFVMKVTCAGGTGAAGKVLRVIETLGFDITYAAVEQLRPRHYLTTTFVRVKKHGRMTESKLKDYIITAAIRSGHLTLQENL